MTTIVQDGADLGLLGAGRGTSRTVFRNPRGNKRYYAIYTDVISANGVVVSEYSTDGITWSGSQNEVLNNDLVGTWHDFDVKIFDDGSQLEVWVVGIGLYPLVDNIVTKYAYGTISDSGSAISWNTEQYIDGDINDEGMSGPHSIALARTDNGEIVVAFTEDFRDMGKNYRQTKLIGSDGDGATPNWSGEAIINDPSESTNNQQKDGAWCGAESFSGNVRSGDGVTIALRVPEATDTTNYGVLALTTSWDQGGSGFSDTGPSVLSGVAAHDDTGQVLSLVIDGADFWHIVTYDGSATTLDHHKGTNIVQVGLNTEIGSHDADALCIAVNDSPSASLGDPTSDEGTSGLWNFQTGSTFYSMLDDGLSPSTSTWVSTASSNSWFRVGGFNGGLAPVVTYALFTGNGANFDIATYKDGSLVETLATGASLNLGATLRGFQPTDSDWNEIRIEASLSPASSVVFYNIAVDGRTIHIQFHDSGDIVDWEVQWEYLWDISFPTSKLGVVSYHQDITALSSWSRAVENSLHVAGQYGTNVIYNEHPVYKALSTTLADLVFPDQNYYLGPHST